MRCVHERRRALAVCQVPNTPADVADPVPITSALTMWGGLCPSTCTASSSSLICPSTLHPFIDTNSHFDKHRRTTMKGFTKALQR